MWKGKKTEVAVGFAVPGLEHLVAGNRWVKFHEMPACLRVGIKGIDLYARMTKKQTGEFSS